MIVKHTKFIGGAFEGELNTDNPYGFKIEFIEGDVWELSKDALKGIKCKSDRVFVRLPEQMVKEIFGEVDIS